MAKKLKWNLILMSVLYLGLGIFLLMRPSTALNVVCYALGGVVLACDAEPESAKLKYLFDVAPASACLTPELLRLVHFLKERTFCTYYVTET